MSINTNTLQAHATFFSLKCVEEIKSALHFSQPMVDNKSLHTTIMYVKSLDFCLAPIYVRRYQGHYIPQDCKDWQLRNQLKS